MALPFYLSYTAGPSNANMSYSSYDGTYIWFITRSSTYEKRLYRFRVSDQQLIKPDGSIGDYTNAYVALDTWLQYSAVVSTGTYVLTVDRNTSSAVGVYRHSDMSAYGRVSIAANLVSSTESGYYRASDGSVFLPGWDSSVGRAAIYKFDPAALTYVKIYTSPQASSNGVYLTGVGDVGYLTTATNGFGVEKVDLNSGTRLWVTPTIGTAQLWVVRYDAARGELWATGSATECVRIRDSDGSFLTRTATADTYLNSRLAAPATDGGITYSTGMAFIGDKLFVGGGSSSAKVVYRSTSPTVSPATGLAATGIALSTLYAFNVTPEVVVGSRVYCLMNGRYSLSWGATGIAWFDFDASIPTMITVDPRTGPTLRLGFDLPVNAGTPLLGAPADGVGVTGTAQVDTTHIDIDLALTPDAPVGNAQYRDFTPPIAEADVLGPHAPSGVKAKVT